eukprot:5681915-Amphidinium_carterae.1
MSARQHSARSAHKTTRRDHCRAPCSNSFVWVISIGVAVPTSLPTQYSERQRVSKISGSQLFV